MSAEPDDAASESLAGVENALPREGVPGDAVVQHRRVLAVQLLDGL